MLRRFLILLPLVLLLAMLFSTGKATADVLEFVEWRSPLGDDGVVCDFELAWRNRQACPQYGPVTTAARIANMRLPDPLPELAVVPLKTPGGNVVPFTYAQVVEDNAPVHSHPAEAVSGIAPVRRLGTGYVWVSVEAKTAYEGREFYQINAGEYVPMEALSVYQPSAFQGVVLAQHPDRPFAWILRAVRPLLAPAGEANADAPVYQRYQLVQIFATERTSDQVWYLIGPDQWINQVYVGKVALTAVPGGVEPGAAWIDIDLFEQTLAAYVGDRMVYATLVSTGLPGWNTPPGLFRTWHKVRAGKMSGAENRPDYYFLEDVPWTLYFNRDVALHGAYWHDGFGYRHSHGCVNLAPLDAKWLFGWAPDAVWVQVRSGMDSLSN